MDGAMAALSNRFSMEGPAAGLEGFFVLSPPLSPSVDVLSLNSVGTLCIKWQPLAGGDHQLIIGRPTDHGIVVVESGNHQAWIHQSTMTIAEPFFEVVFVVFPPMDPPITQ